jgi:GNAT superfamily N-acetyltransferase
VNDPALAAACDESWVAAFSMVARTARRGVVEEVEGATIAATGVTLSALNLAFVIAPVPDPHATVTAVVERFEKLGVPFLLIARSDGDPALPAAAEARGLGWVGDTPGMGAEPVPGSSEKRVESLRTVPVDRRSHRDFAAVTASAFELPLDVVQDVFGLPLLEAPGVAGWAGYVDEEAAATSVAMATGDTVGVYNVATMPWLRRRGLGTHMTRLALEHGIQAGCGRAVLQASPTGRPLYERMGFRTVATYRMFGRL